MLCSYAHAIFLRDRSNRQRDRSEHKSAIPLIPTYLTWVKLAAQPLKVDPHSLCDY